MLDSAYHGEWQEWAAPGRPALLPIRQNQQLSFRVQAEPTPFLGVCCPPAPTPNEPSLPSLFV